MRQIVVMFDLEATIIDSWNSACPLLKKIKFIDQILNRICLSNSTIIFGIFSFAIDHEHEKQLGINLASHYMNCEIDYKFVPCWNELENLCQFQVKNLQKWEIINLFAKEGMFQIWCNQFPNLDFILFDDALQFKEQILKRDGQTITMIKV